MSSKPPVVPKNLRLKYPNQTVPLFLHSNWSKTVIFQISTSYKKVGLA